MKKLKLAIDELAVESFDTSAVDRGEGSPAWWYLAVV